MSGSPLPKKPRRDKPSQEATASGEPSQEATPSGEPSQGGILLEETAATSRLDADGTTLAGDASTTEYERQMKEMLDKKTNPDEPYCLDNPHLGHAVIVNNIATECKGSEKDVEKLKEVYEEMGFTVHVKRDCSVADMKDLTKWMTTELDYKESNCFWLTVMSHGTEDGRLSDKKDEAGRCRYPWKIEEIVRKLSEVKTLVGKPKILTIYACRGHDASPGQITDTLATQAKLDRIADKADFYIAYGTVPGYVSAAPRSFGSFYFQSLAKNLKDYYMTHSLDRIFICVRHDMEDIKQDFEFEDQSGNEQVVKDAKQCPEDSSSLRRVLNFSEFLKQRGKASIRKMPVLEAQLQTQKEKAEQQDQELQTQKAKIERRDRESVTQKKKIAQQDRKIKRMLEKIRNTAEDETTPPKEVQCAVTKTIRTRLQKGDFICMCLLSADTVLIGGERNECVGFIAPYKFPSEEEEQNEEEQNEEEQNEIRLTYTPQAMTKLKLGDQDVVALAYSNKQEIEFRPVTDLRNAGYIHQVSPATPQSLHSSGPSTLLYVDSSRQPYIVRTLDCSRDKPVQGTTNIRQNSISYMCCVRDKQLLITTACTENVLCYNMQDQDEDPWEVNEELNKEGLEAFNVTSDDKRGQIYINDNLNDCILAFSVSDRRYLGRVISKGEQGLGSPADIKWCDNTESLIVVHSKYDEFFISVIKVGEEAPSE